MKTIRGTILILTIIVASAVQTYAIEHLQISVQCTNVVLRWPCLDDGSETIYCSIPPHDSANGFMANSGNESTSHVRKPMKCTTPIGESF